MRRCSSSTIFCNCQNKFKLFRSYLKILKTGTQNQQYPTFSNKQRPNNIPQKYHPNTPNQELNVRFPVLSKTACVKRGVPPGERACLGSEMARLSIFELKVIATLANAVIHPLYGGVSFSRSTFLGLFSY